MKNTVTRLKPRQGSIESARAAFASGHFDFSAELLANASTLPDLILLSRSFLRLGLPAKALSTLSATRLSDVSHELAAETLAVQVTALNALRRFEDAAKLSVEARVRCISAGVVAIEAELLLIQAIGHLLEENYSEAELAARSILDLEQQGVTWLDPTSYQFNLAYLRFRACGLLGSIEGTRSDYSSQFRWLIQAFDEFDGSGVRDDYMEALVLTNFAGLPMGIELENLVEIAVARAKRIEWSKPLAGFEFSIFSSLAQASSTIGDQLGALRFLRRCSTCAPTAALQLRSTIERGRMLADIGESFSSREELDHAIRLSKTIDWANARESDQRQLLFLAAQVAKYSVTEANRILSRYDGLECSLPDMVTVRDDRFRGEELVARSLILRANGETARAVRMLMDASEVFTAAHDHANAASVAAELAELTQEPHYLDTVRQQCRNQPQSILARRMARIESLFAEGVLA